MADPETPYTQTPETPDLNTPPNQDSLAPEINAEQPTAPDANIPDTPKKRRWPKYLVIILFIVILIVGVFFALDYIRKPDSDKTSGTAKHDIQSLTVGVVSGSTKVAYTPDDIDSYAQSVYAQIYEGLVAYQDKTKIVPLLATGWSNPDSSTWDFQLAKGVKFSNGDLMTSADVVYSIKQAIQTPDGVYSGTIKDIKPLGDYQVEITTSSPDPFLLNKLTFLMILDSRVSDPNAAIGTGPYKLKPGVKPTDTKVSLVANDAYHGGHVYTRNLKFVVEESEDVASADLKSGKINIAGEFTSDNPAGLKNFNYQKLIANDAAVNFVSINSVAPGPLQKLEVRQALRDSIDVPKLIKDSDLAADPSYQMVTPTIPGYNPSLTAPKQDVAHAKALLAQAGYPNGVTLTLEASSTNAAVARQIAAQAKNAGFTINVTEQTDFDQFISDLVGGKLQLGLISYGSDTLDGGDVFTQAVQQTENFKSAALDDYLDQAASTVDQQKRLQILQKTSKLINDNVATLPLYNRHRLWAMDKPYMIQFDSLSAAPGIYFSKVYTVN